MPIITRRTAWILFAIMASIMVVSVQFLKDPLYYPWLETNLAISGQAPLNMRFLNYGTSRRDVCERQLDNMRKSLAQTCPNCEIKAASCLHPPSAKQRSYLSNEPVGEPVAVYPYGVVIFTSSNPDLALSACQQSQAASPIGLSLQCLRSAQAKPVAQTEKHHSHTLLFALLGSLITALAAWLLCFLIIRYEHLHAHFSHDHTEGGPQKFHTEPTPRIGGIGIFGGLLAASLVFQSVGYRFNTQEFSALLLAAIPAFAFGLAEDITKRVGVTTRLLATMLSAGIGAILLDGTITRLGIPGVDSVLQWAPLAILFTVIAVAGLANSINIIDGYNGLASGYAIIALTALGAVAWFVGDGFVAIAAFSMAGALAGFIYWNWPHGKIFLGDGGAYFVGFWLGELSVLLVARNSEVSPWFPLTILIHPIIETLFSIYRRKLVRGRSPGQPDALHMHQLIYKRVVKGERYRTNSSAKNATVAGYLLLPATAIAVVAALSFKLPSILVTTAILYCLIYTTFYRKICRWQTPDVWRKKV